MSWPLLKLMLIVYFGRHSPSPFQAAWSKLLAMAATMTIFGYIISTSLANATLPHDLPQLWTAAVTASLAYVVGGLIFLVVGANYPRDAAKLLWIWPLSRRERWNLTVFPSIIIWLILMLFGTQLTFALARALAMPAYILFIAMAAGLLSAMASGLFRRPASLGLRTAIFTLSAALQAYLLTKAIGNEDRLQMLSLASCLLIALVLFGFVDSYRHANIVMRDASTKLVRLRLPARLMSSLWFVVKLARSKRMQNVFWFNLVLCLGVATMVYLRHIDTANYFSWMLFSAVLSITYACEVRGISSRYKAWEIFGLRGSGYFLQSQFLGTYAPTFVISSPILIVCLLTSSASLAAMLINFICLQLFAVGLGLLASTIFVPEKGDIGAQFMAGITGTGVMMAIVRYGKLVDIPLVLQCALLVVLSIFCFEVMREIEKIRSKNYGRA